MLSYIYGHYNTNIKHQFSFLTQCVRFFMTPWIAVHQASLSITNSQSLLRLVSIQSVMSSYYLILCHPLLLLPSIFPSIRVFSNESALPVRWPKYWSFIFSISPSNEYSGLISFRMDWLDLFAVQGTLKSLFQHHSSKASILHSAFFMVQLSHPYMTTGKTVTLSRIRWPKRRAATCLSNWALSPVFSSVIQNYYNFICMSWCETCCEGMTSGIWKPFRGERESERQKERETHRGREREDNDARTEKITKEIKS